jgi:hypothetical protein
MTARITHIADHSQAALEHLRKLWIEETMTILDEEEMEDYAEEAALVASGPTITQAEGI